MQLRAYQRAAVNQVLDYAIEHPTGRALLVLPPRSGKTLTAVVVVMAMALAHDLPVLWIAHREELIEGAVEHLVACCLSASQIGVIQADRRANPEALIQVASEATLDRRSKPPARLVVLDEAHHDAAARRRRLRSLYPDAFHLGLTGTPVRLDGRGLDADYDTMIVAAQPSELVLDGHLVVPTIYAPAPEDLPSLRGVRLVGGDFDPSGLERIMAAGAMVRSVVGEWERLAEGRRTVVFPVTVKHSRALVRAFQKAGHAAEHLDGDTPAGRRRDILQALRRGDLALVASVGVLSEGTDLPEVECVLLGRHTRSLGLFMQQTARCMTPCGDKRPLILDPVGNTYRHGFPFADREWSLTRERSSRARAKTSPITPSVKRCSTCGALASALATVCASPTCGAPFAPLPAPPEEPVELHEVKATPGQVAAERARLEAFAARRGFATGWVERVLAAKFGAEVAAA